MSYVRDLFKAVFLAAFLTVCLVTPILVFGDSASSIKNLMELGVPSEVATELVNSLSFEDITIDDDLTVGDDLTVTGESTLTGAVGFGSTLIGTGTATLGWAVVAGANTACTTTCVTPCVFGVNTAATEADIVACADATADECLCAGAS